MVNTDPSARGYLQVQEPSYEGFGLRSKMTRIQIFAGSYYEYQMISDTILPETTKPATPELRGEALGFIAERLR